MGCKKFFHCINLNILISQVNEFCERWYMRHRWPWCINSEKKDLIAALARWLFWGLRVCFFATFPFCAKLNLPTCGQASEVVYNMQVHFGAKHLLWEEIHVAGLCAPVPLRACTRAQCTVQCAVHVHSTSGLLHLGNADGRVGRRPALAASVWVRPASFPPIHRDPSSQAGHSRFLIIIMCSTDWMQLSVNSLC